MQYLLLNPITGWFLWYIKKIFLEMKYRSKHLKIGYMASARKCTFGKFNTLYSNSKLKSVNIGDFSYISHNTQIMNTDIGKFCSIGPNVKCGLGIHPSRNFVSTHPIFFSAKKQSQITFSDKDYFVEYKKISIGNDVWIGYGAIILDGAEIGDGAIIAAGSVVTKDVSPYAIVGGVPAKLIRYRFEEKMIKTLLEDKWWDKDVSWLKANYKKFHDIHSYFDLSE